MVVSLQKIRRVTIVSRRETMISQRKIIIGSFKGTNHGHPTGDNYWASPNHGCAKHNNCPPKGDHDWFPKRTNNYFRIPKNNRRLSLKPERF